MQDIIHIGWKLLRNFILVLHYIRQTYYKIELKIQPVDFD